VPFLYLPFFTVSLPFWVNLNFFTEIFFFPSFTEVVFTVTVPLALLIVSGLTVRAFVLNALALMDFVFFVTLSVLAFLLDFTITLYLAVLSFDEVTVMIAVPSLTAWITPIESTSATEVLFDFAVNFFEALPFTFTVTLYDLVTVFLLAGIVIAHAD
jgi:hypothetical protein